MATIIFSTISICVAICSIVANIVISKINFKRQSIPFLQVTVPSEIEEGYGAPWAIIECNAENGFDVSFDLQLRNVGLGLARDIRIQYDNGKEKYTMAPRLILNKGEDAIFSINIESEDIKPQPTIRVYFKGILGGFYMTEMLGVYLTYQDEIRFKGCGYELKKVSRKEYPEEADIHMRFLDD